MAVHIKTVASARHVVERGRASVHGDLVPHDRYLARCCRTRCRVVYVGDKEPFYPHTQPGYGSKSGVLRLRREPRDVHVKETIDNLVIEQRQSERDDITGVACIEPWRKLRGHPDAWQQDGDS